MLVQNTATRRKSGADLGYAYTEVVMGLVSVIQQTLSLSKIILQTLRGGKPTRKLQDIFSILLISIGKYRVPLIAKHLCSAPKRWITVSSDLLCLEDNLFPIYRVNVNERSLCLTKSHILRYETPIGVDWWGWDKLWLCLSKGVLWPTMTQFVVIKG